MQVFSKIVPNIRGSKAELLVGGSLAVIESSGVSD